VGRLLLGGSDPHAKGTQDRAQSAIELAIKQRDSTILEILKRTTDRPSSSNPQATDGSEMPGVPQGDSLRSSATSGECLTELVGSSSMAPVDVHREKSHTNLLIEYFEGSKGPDNSKSKSKPSIRVRVTPDPRERSRRNDASQFTGTGKDRKPIYTRRISLNTRRPEEKVAESTEICHDLLSGRSPDLLLHTPVDASVSSMLGDNTVESSLADSELTYNYEPEGNMMVSKAEYLKAPTHNRSRSASQEGTAQKAIERRNHQSGMTRRSSRDYEESELEHRRRRSLKPSSPQGSKLVNNPKLLEMVEDTIKRMILP
jgi:hypothetical protein